ncbi:hypothetical protein PR048_006777 [Dryococelus australis]|uniref:Uncharacterized protein n=1 Tax=Dryococelus australis TaxID=614101 RepID=A0ABQ9IBV8_9NEOP|nr:hypothetical protein PR048_006777 [Dryococelus australis]
MGGRELRCRPVPAGNSVGAATAFPLCGMLIAKLGWEYAFYVPGMLGITWCFLWWVLAFDSPAEHPRISRKELEMIQREVQPHLARKQVRYVRPQLPTFLNPCSSPTLFLLLRLKEP